MRIGSAGDIDARVNNILLWFRGLYAVESWIFMYFLFVKILYIIIRCEESLVVFH